MDRDMGVVQQLLSKGNVSKKLVTLELEVS